MSSINPIAATKIAAGSNAQAPKALQGATGVTSDAANANFFDMIIARLAAATEAGAKTTDAKAADIAANAAATTNAAPAQPQNPLAMLQVALASQSVDADGNIVLNAEEGSGKIQTQLDFTNQIINHLKTMLPGSAEKEGVFAKILARLQAKSDTLQASLSALQNGVITKDTAVEDIPMPMLISLGLSPSEISQVTNKINELEKKLGRDITVEDLIAGVGGIVPPAPETTVVAAAGANIQVLKEISADDAEPTDDLAAKLNALSVGGSDNATGSTDGKIEDKHVMKGLPELDKASLKDGATPVDSLVKTPKPDNFKDHIVNMINSNRAAQGDMMFPVSQFNGDADAAIFQPYGISATPGMTLGTTAQASNVIATSATAGQAHPATNLVAANIVKFASQGENQTMQIRLDPPELGNVSVRLQFGKDKAIKAHLTVEKPETYMMLQRDGHALERALQSAGLDAQTGSISFELANQDNNPFNNNGEGGTDDNFGGGNAGLQDVGAGDEIIQSSVSWQVDPSTGHVRYNLFA